MGWPSDDEKASIKLEALDRGEMLHFSSGLLISILQHGERAAVRTHVTCPHSMLRCDGDAFWRSRSREDGKSLVAT